jgi:hypothetical protein
MARPIGCLLTRVILSEAKDLSRFTPDASLALSMTAQ